MFATDILHHFANKCISNIFSVYIQTYSVKAVFYSATIIKHFFIKCSYSKVSSGTGSQEKPWTEQAKGGLDALNFFPPIPACCPEERTVHDNLSEICISAAALWPQKKLCHCFCPYLPGKITAERSDTVALTVLSLVFLQELRHLIARKVCLPLWAQSTTYCTSCSRDTLLPSPQ